MYDKFVAAWFKARFGKMAEDDPGYFRTWMDRFKSGPDTAISYMDAESKKECVKVMGGILDDVEIY